MSTFKLGVSVANAEFVRQRVTLVVSMKPFNGPLPAFSRTFHVTLAPLQSYAFTSLEIAVVPSERATLELRLTGAPASPTLTRSKRYRVEMSPSGHS